MKNLATAALCALASAGLLFFSTGLGEVWAVAWIACLPVLWLAYGKGPAWQVALAGFIAFFLGNTGFFEAFAGETPAIIATAIALALDAVLFALALLFTRLVHRRLGLFWALIGFPAFWTAVEYGVSVASPNGTAGSLAYTLVGAPILIQSASLFGIWSLTFLVCLTANGLALAIRGWARAVPVIAVVAVVFLANLGFGALRLREPPSGTLRIAVAAWDAPGKHQDAPSSIALAQAYADTARRLAKDGANVVVLPEMMVRLKPEWREAAIAPLTAAAKDSGARIVAGFLDLTPGNKRNLAMVFEPKGEAITYFKRKMVVGLDNSKPGDRSGVLDDRTAVAICKDLDFQDMIRKDNHAGVRLMLVPAEDFIVDRWMHSRMAVLRGVEDGFTLARAARKGDVTISDDRGRILARAQSGPVMISAVAAAPLGSGATLYLKIGDVFAWLCVALVVLAGGLALSRPKLREV